MKLTVITINYNNADGLKRTVGSVLSQTAQNFEYVVIDGGSSDGSRDIVNAIADGRLAFTCCEPDGGIYDAMNKGVGHSNGEYVLFLNSGDTFASERVLQEAIPALNGVDDVVYGNLIFRETDGREWTQVPPDELTVNFFLNHSLPHPATFIRRQMLVDAPYDLTYPIVADWAWFVRKIVVEGCRTRHLDMTVSRFEMGGVSNGNPRHDEERARATSELFSAPVLLAAATVRELELCGLTAEISSLAATRKLHRRLRPLLRAIINSSLKIDKLLKCRR